MSEFYFVIMISIYLWVRSTYTLHDKTIRKINVYAPTYVSFFLHSLYAPHILVAAVGFEPTPRRTGVFPVMAFGVFQMSNKTFMSTAF